MTSTTNTSPYTVTLSRDVQIALGVAVILTGLSYIVAFLAKWVPDGINWLEVAAVFTSYTATWLSVKQRRFNYLFGALSTALYCILFAQYGLIASAVLNGYLAFALVYGWFRWRSDAKARPVTRVTGWWGWVYIAVAAAAFGVGYLAVRLFNGTFNIFDAGILGFTILAQILLDNKKIETWLVWVIVNVLAIYVYFTTGLPLAGFQYIFFLANTIYGFYSWRKTMPAQAAV